MLNKKVVVRGAGDLATAIGHRLFNVGFHVVMTELQAPKVVRRTVSFANCIYEDEMMVEGVCAIKTSFDEIDNVIKDKKIPIVVDKEGELIHKLKPHIVIDAIMAKKNFNTNIDDAPIVIGIGPGFEASVDVDAVIETMRGHNLGKIIYNGTPLKDTGVPGPIGGFTKERLLRAPSEGLISMNKKIGDKVKAGDIIGYVGNKEIKSEIDGVIRGLIHNKAEVKMNEKIGDVDPRGDISYCNTISDKGRTISGGVLEAILVLMREIKI